MMDIKKHTHYTMIDAVCSNIVQEEKYKIKI